MWKVLIFQPFINYVFQRDKVLAGRNLLICSVRTIWTFFADENMQTRTESKFYYEFLEVIKRYRFQASSFWLRKISIGLFIQFPRNFHELFFKCCQIFLNVQEICQISILVENDTGKMTEIKWPLFQLILLKK